MGDREAEGAERRRADDALSSRISGHIAAIEAAWQAEREREAELRGRISIMETRIGLLEQRSMRRNWLSRLVGSICI